MRRKRIDVYADGSVSVIDDIPKVAEMSIVPDEHGVAIASEEIKAEDFEKLNKEDLRLVRFNPETKKMEKWVDKDPKPVKPNAIS